MKHCETYVSRAVKKGLSQNQNRKRLKHNICILIVPSFKFEF